MLSCVIVRRVRGLLHRPGGAAGGGAAGRRPAGDRHPGPGVPHDRRRHAPQRGAGAVQRQVPGAAELLASSVCEAGA